MTLILHASGFSPQQIGINKQVITVPFLIIFIWCIWKSQSGIERSISKVGIWQVFKTLRIVLFFFFLLSSEKHYLLSQLQLHFPGTILINKLLTQITETLNLGQLLLGWRLSKLWEKSQGLGPTALRWAGPKQLPLAGSAHPVSLQLR